MPTQLSTGSIERLLAGSENEKPVLQILGAKKISAGSSERYRLFVSDGVQASSFAMLATQLNHLVEDGSLEKYTIVRLDSYVLNVVNSNRQAEPSAPIKRVLIIMDINVLESGEAVGCRIGDPTSVEAATGDNPPSRPNVPARASENVPVRPVQNGKPRSSDRPIHPISNLNPYQNRWTVRVRVTNKGTIRTWSNSRGEGKLFSMDLLDESGEIRATAFNKECDKYYDMVEVNKLYYISQAQLKTANKNFTSIKNDYEMNFNSDTLMEPCHDQIDEIPRVQMNFVSIASLANQDNNSMVDVIGVCKRAADVQTLITKATNREVKKRDLTLVDSSNTEISLTLWDKQAEEFDADGFPIVAVKGVRVSDFGGRSLSMVSSGMLLRNPNIPEAHTLRVWYDREGSSTQTQSLSRSGGSGGFETNWKYLKQLKTENLGSSDKPDYFTCKAVVSIAKADNSLYQACPSAECNKKVIDLNNGSYRCEKCNKEYPDFKWRIILQLHVADYTDGTWVTCFQESAEMMLGKTSQELGDLKNMNSPQFNKVFQDLHHEQFIFKLRAKMESFNDELRMKVAAVTVTPVDANAYIKKLIDDIQALN